jgi:nucleoside-diphosphate-sugar epimerase
MPSLLIEDLDHVFEKTRPLWAEMQDGHLFLAGGSGFFGKWLIETFLSANRRLGLNARVTVLARNPDRLQAELPHLVSGDELTFLQGDVRSFPLEPEVYTHMIHAASDATMPVTPETADELIDVIVNGTRRLLSYASATGVKKFLYCSSGAVYGPQQFTAPVMSEDSYFGPPSASFGSAYAEGKRVAESLCCAEAARTGLEVKIARPFAFIGPYLPLDAHFAAGNFIRDVLMGRPINLTGDGTPVRSYLYAADLAVWLWTILFEGQSARPYNVGSEHKMTVADLARLTARFSKPPLKVTLGPSSPDSRFKTNRYVPATERARRELGLIDSFSLFDSIDRTLRFYRQPAEATPLLESSKWQTSTSATLRSEMADLATSSLKSA